MIRKIVLPLMLVPAMALAAKEKCKVIITAAEGAKPYELVIKKKSEDPKDSELRTKLESGIYECEIETDDIELQTVVDFGEVMAKGSTGRTADFFVEDGATIRILFDGEALTVDSDGQEFVRQKQMQDKRGEWLDGRISELGGRDSLTDEQESLLRKDLHQWEIDYYRNNPMLAFLLEIANELSYFRFNNSKLAGYLDLYHQSYEGLYPGHPAHAEIAKAENEGGLQIMGRKYHDYTVYDADGQEVKASDYFAGKPTLVICWATWCLPCRKEAKEIVPLFEKYQTRGLNAFSLAREFTSADNFKAAIAEDKNPWPCLYDLDDRFKIFDRHGVTSSALLLLDADGNIVAAGYDWSDLEEALKKMFPAD